MKCIEKIISAETKSLENNEYSVLLTAFLMPLAEFSMTKKNRARMETAIFTDSLQDVKLPDFPDVQYIIFL